MKNIDVFQVFEEVSASPPLHRCLLLWVLPTHSQYTLNIVFFFLLPKPAVSTQTLSLNIYPKTHLFTPILIKLYTVIIRLLHQRCCCETNEGCCDAFKVPHAGSSLESSEHQMLHLLAICVSHCRVYQVYLFVL